MSSSWSRLLCLVFLLQAPLALAQSEVSTPVASTRSGDPAYDGLIEKAVAEFNVGHWGEAKAFFLRAHQLRPNARTFRSLGHTSYELRLYVDAIGYFLQALRSQEQPLTPQLRANVEQQLADARSFVTHVQLQLEPAHVAVRVDGRDAAFDDDGTLLLDPGLHELSASAAEYEPQVRTVTAHGAERMTLTFSLSPLHRASRMPELELEPEPEPEQPVLVDAEPIEPPLGAAGETALAAPTRAPASSLGTQQWVGIGLGAAGVVAGGIALGFSVAAASENSESKRSCDANGCDAAGRAARKSALAHADIATVSAIMAGALVASGVVCFLASPSQERQTASLHIAPVAYDKAAGLIVSGQF